MQFDLTSVFTKIAVLFILIALGYAAKKTKIINGAFDSMFSRLVLTFCIPGLVTNSVLNAETLPSTEDILTCIGLSIACYAFMTVLAEVLVRLMLVPKGRRGVYRFMLLFSNVGFIGFPVLTAIFGSWCLIYAAIFNLSFNVLVFTQGAFYLSRDDADLGDEEAEKFKTEFRFDPRLFLTPAVVFSILAIVLCLLHINYIPVVSEASAMLSQMCIPCAMFIIGSSLANLGFKELAGSPRIYALAFLRLFGIAFCVWFVFHFFVSDPTMLGVMTVLAGMPVATNGSMLCYQYGGDLKTMSQSTFISTVLSIVSIPVLVLFLQAVL